MFPKSTHNLLIYVLGLCFGVGQLVACSSPEQTQTDMTSARDMSTADIDGPIDMSTDLDVNLPKQVGDPCNGPLECGEGKFCVKQQDTFVCMSGCNTPYTICPGGQVCTSLAGGTTNVCYLGGATEAKAPCADNIECPSGHLCIGTANERYCIRACHEDNQACEQGQTCLPIAEKRGFCHQSVGTPCDETTQCPASLACSESENTAQLPSPICTKTECATDEECPGTSRCIQLDTQGTTACINACKTDADCIFAQDFRCKGSSICSQSSAPTECLKWIGQNKLCLHKDTVF